MGNFCLQYDDSGGGGGTEQRSLSAYISSIPNGALGGLLRAKTNPTSGGTGGPSFVAMDNGALNAVFVKWRSADGKFELIDNANNTLAGPTTTVFDAASPAWLWWNLRWAKKNGTTDVWFGLWDANRNFIEELFVNTWAGLTGSINRILLGPLSGARAGWWMGNMYLHQASAYTPVAPNFAAQVMNSGPGADNSTLWVPDTGGDDSTNEYQRIDDPLTSPPNDTDYLKVVLSGSLELPSQFYGHAAGLVPAGNAILAVAVVPRRWEDAASDAVQDSRMKLGSVQIAGPSGLLGADSTWTHEFGLFRATDPNNKDWTIANLDAMRPGHRIVGTAGEQRVSQLILYAVYQPATQSLVTLPAGGNPRLNPLLRR